MGRRLPGEHVLALPRAPTHTHFHHAPPPTPRAYAQLGHRCLTLLAMTGVLLVVLQPPLPLRGGAKCPRLPLAL